MQHLEKIAASEGAAALVLGVTSRSHEPFTTSRSRLKRSQRGAAHEGTGVSGRLRLLDRECAVHAYLDHPHTVVVGAHEALTASMTGAGLYCATVALDTLLNGANAGDGSL